MNLLHRSSKLPATPQPPPTSPQTPTPAGPPGRDPLGEAWAEGTAFSGLSSSKAHGGAVSPRGARRHSFSASSVGLRLSGRWREDGGTQGVAGNSRGRGDRGSSGKLGSGGGISFRSRHPRPVVPSRWVCVWVQPSGPARRAEVSLKMLWASQGPHTVFPDFYLPLFSPQVMPKNALSRGRSVFTFLKKLS